MNGVYWIAKNYLHEDNSISHTDVRTQFKIQCYLLVLWFLHLRRCHRPAQEFLNAMRIFQILAYQWIRWWNLSGCVVCSFTNFSKISKRSNIRQYVCVFAIQPDLNIEMNKSNETICGHYNSNRVSLANLSKRTILSQIYMCSGAQSLFDTKLNLSWSADINNTNNVSHFLLWFLFHLRPPSFFCFASAFIASGITCRAVGMHLFWFYQQTIHSNIAILPKWRKIK